MTGWAGTVGTVEGKVFRCKSFEADVAVEAGVLFGVKPVFPFVFAGLNHRDHQSFAGGKRQLDRVVDAAAGCGINYQPVDDGFDGMLFVFVEVRDRVEFTKFAIDTNADKALMSDGGKNLFVFSFASAHQRREQHDFGFFRNL